MSVPPVAPAGPGPDRADLYSVLVAVGSRDRSTLLSLASVLHARAVDVLRAELVWLTEDTRAFRATISGTARQAATVEQSLRAMVMVTEADVAPLGQAATEPEGR